MKELTKEQQLLYDDIIALIDNVVLNDHQIELIDKLDNLIEIILKQNWDKFEKKIGVIYEEIN